MQDNIKKAVQAVLNGMKISEAAEKYDVERTRLGRLVEGAQIGISIATENADCAQCAQKDAEIESLRAQLETLRASGASGGTSGGDPITCPGLVYLTRAVASGKADVSCSDVRAEWEKMSDILKEKDAEIAKAKKMMYEYAKRYTHLERASKKLQFALRQGQKSGIVKIEDMKKFQDLIAAG